MRLRPYWRGAYEYSVQPSQLRKRARAKLLLAAKVASMMGRKLEEGDWKEVYCKAKNIPDSGWSNLQIDVNYRGLGIEIKIASHHPAWSKVHKGCLRHTKNAPSRNPLHPD